ncbi:hypothetical protein M9H77_07378 [Catharanthus roseus]|uniref:Uncharacterized protein n=1 Tax=Catharanthus roseus TaxID=4058 RepID=A0ACC0BV21_CATRO|nr:hypothetical protein M9H77_07378 [Catharanthus roseus]
MTTLKKSPETCNTTKKQRGGTARAFDQSCRFDILSATQENVALQRRKRKEEKIKGKCCEEQKSLKGHGETGFKSKLREKSPMGQGEKSEVRNERKKERALAATLERLRTFCDEVNAKYQAQHCEDKIDRDSRINYLSKKEGMIRPKGAPLQDYTIGGFKK